MQFAFCMKFHLKFASEALSYIGYITETYLRPDFEKSQ